MADLSTLTAEELAKKVRECPSYLYASAKLATQDAAILLQQHGEQIASYLEELATLRRQLAAQDRVPKLDMQSAEMLAAQAHASRAGSGE